ncbi:RrF2 family transcriptional regulator [Christensenella timonensis]|uniref:RrF2 family transcriptional regulator n=1 Tax=Christensenella timonensis TaxID=1816678 RepID=UPI00082B04FD|nr:Rrf2 family transcriptional regulator [Christensenella timonensis]
MTGEFTIAVHALVYLNHKQEMLSSDELAKNVCTHPARIRKVMSKLKKAGLLTTKEGAVGGYAFRLDPKGVTLRMVSDALEEPLVAAGWRSGNADMKCLVASGMAAVMDGIYAGLDRACKERLGKITIADIDAMIFKEHSKTGS